MNATTLKGLLMKYKHFREIEPSNKTDFIMLYFAACRSLHELETAIQCHRRLAAEYIAEQLSDIEITHL